MFTTPEQFAAANKAAVDSLLSVANTAAVPTNEFDHPSHAQEIDGYRDDDEVHQNAVALIAIGRSMAPVARITHSGGSARIISAAAAMLASSARSNAIVSAEGKVAASASAAVPEAR